MDSFVGMGFRVFSHTLATYAPLPVVKSDHISKNPQHQPDARMAQSTPNPNKSPNEVLCAPPLS